MPVILYLRILPQHNLPRPQGLLHIDNPLVLRPPEPQADILFRLHKLPVHDHVQTSQKLLHIRPLFAEIIPNIPVKEIPGIAPHILVLCKVNQNS